MRLRNSASSASGVLTWKGRIAVASTTSASCVITVSFAAGSRLLAEKRVSCQVLAALAAASLSRHPFADVGRTVSEVDAIPFSAGQEHHDITVDQFDLREVDSGHTVFL